MDTRAMLALLEAKPGKEKDLEAFLKSAQPLAVAEPATTTWYAVKLGPARFGIFDTFPNDPAARLTSPAKSPRRSWPGPTSCSPSRRN